MHSSNVRAQKSTVDTKIYEALISTSSGTPHRLKKQHKERVHQNMEKRGRGVTVRDGGSLCTPILEMTNILENVKWISQTFLCKLCKTTFLWRQFFTEFSRSCERRTSPWSWPRIPGLTFLVGLAVGHSSRVSSSAFAPCGRANLWPVANQQTCDAVKTTTTILATLWLSVLFRSPHVLRMTELLRYHLKKNCLWSCSLHAHDSS